MNLEDLLTGLMPYRKIKHSFVKQYAISTIRETSTDLYETALIDPNKIYILYSGPSRISALWSHWKARFNMQRNKSTITVIGYGDKYDDTPIKLGPTRTINLDKESKKATVVDLKDYK